MTLREVPQPARLSALFAKSLVTARFGGASLPDDVLQVTELAIEASRLAAYQRVCGFRVRSQVPSTYLHVLAFGLATELMAAKAFPLPLPGLVHVANRIEQSRPLTMTERVTLTVHAEQLRPHPRGTQVDLVAVGRVDGEQVFSGRSTYLRRTAARSTSGSGAGSGSTVGSASTGVGILWRVPGDIGRRYAVVSGDSNPIHLSPLTARLFGFPRAIAHGMWLAARTLSALENRLPPAYVHDVAFKLPVLLPATVRFDAGHVGDGWSLAVSAAASGKPHLTGTLAPAE